MPMLSMGGEKVLHWERALLADDAALLLRRPTGYKEVTREPVPIRESGKYVNRNPKTPRDGEVWLCERYYVQVVGQGLRDYGTDQSRSRNFIVGTNCRFFKRKFRDGVPEPYDGYGLEFPLTPYYQEDNKKGKKGRHGHHGQKRIQAAPVQAFSDPSGSDDEEEQQKWPRDLELDDDEFVLKYRYLLSADDVKDLQKKFRELDLSLEAEWNAAKEKPDTGASLARATVDLPEPDSPTMPSVRPGLMVKLTSCAAFTPSLRRRKPPPP